MSCTPRPQCPFRSPCRSPCLCVSVVSVLLSAAEHRPSPFRNRARSVAGHRLAGKCRANQTRVIQFCCAGIGPTSTTETQRHGERPQSTTDFVLSVISSRARPLEIDRFPGRRRTFAVSRSRYAKRRYHLWARRPTVWRARRMARVGNNPKGRSSVPPAARSRLRDRPCLRGVRMLLE